MKILTILGARPQFIKAGTVSREIAKYDEIEAIIVHTGQHGRVEKSSFTMWALSPKYGAPMKRLRHCAI